MNSYKIVVNELRQPMIRTGALLGSLIVMMAAAYLYGSDIDSQRLAAQQNLEQTERQYRNAVSSAEILRTEAARFAALRAGGFIGSEPRLRWIQDVRETATASRLVSVRYRLEPRRVAPVIAATGSYSLYVSTMKLDLELRHEGDLMSFLNGLQEQRGGLFIVSDCSLTPADSKRVVNLQGANVKATCELQWYSLDKPDINANGDAS